MVGPNKHRYTQHAQCSHYRGARSGSPQLSVLLVQKLYKRGIVHFRSKNFMPFFLKMVHTIEQLYNEDGNVNFNLAATIGKNQHFIYLSQSVDFWFTSQMFTILDRSFCNG